MGWDRVKVAAALGELVQSLDETVAVFTSQPETFNPPAYVVGFPRTVRYSPEAFGRDLGTLPLMVGVGVLEPEAADAMLGAAKAAIDADPTIGGAVMAATVTEQSGWRRLTIAGADVLAADLVVEIRM